MISAITFRNTPTIQPKKRTNNTSAKIGMILAGVGGATVGYIGFDDYKNIKKDTEQEIKTVKTNTPFNIADSQCNITDEFINNSEYVYKRSKKPATTAELRALGLSLEEILTTEELAIFKENLAKVYQEKNELSDQRTRLQNLLLDQTIRNSKYSQMHPEKHLQTAKDLEKNGLKLEEVLSGSEMKKYFENLKNGDEYMDEEMRDIRLKLEAVYKDAIKDSEYIKNFDPKKKYTSADLKREFLSLTDILTEAEAQDLKNKLDAETDRLKQLEQKTIKELKEKIAKNKSKNLYKIAGIGFGVAFVSMISLFLLCIGNRKSKNAN